MKADAGVPVRDAPPAGSPVAVIVALAVEKRALMRGRAGASGYPILVFQSGPGPARAEAAARRAIEAGARALVAFGFAGGVVANVRPGTVLLPKRLVGADGAALEPCPDWRHRLVLALSGEFAVEEGPLLAVERVLVSPGHKQQAAESTGAAAVDMESAAIGRVAEQAGLPFMALRVASDGLDDWLPDRVETLVAPGGGTRLAPLLAMLLQKKQRRRLWALARHSRMATKRLAELAERFSGTAFLFPAQVPPTEGLH